MSMEEHIARLEAELKAAKLAWADEKRLVADKVQPKYRYTFVPVDNKFDKLYDDACSWWRLEAEILNVEELKAVGKDVKVGGMNYVFNSATGKIVMASGGGHIYVGDSWSTPEHEVRAAYDVLSDFIRNNPEGGDITEHVVAIRAVQERKK